MTWRGKRNDHLNDGNLKKGNPETQFKAGRQAVENGKKGGIASGIAKKKRADIKKTIQDILDNKYTQVDGDKTGAEVLAITLFAVASDPNHKQFIQAQRLIYELTGQDKSPEDKKRIKQALKLQEKEIELVQKKIDKDDDW